MKALIIAAGMGRRIRNLGDSKPLVKLLGLPLIERVIMTARRAGIKDFVVVVGYNGDKVKKELDRIAKKRNVNITIINNSDWQKENGLSVLKAREALNNEKFLLLMSDHIHDQEIIQKLVDFELQDGEVVLAVDRKIDTNHLVDHDDVTKVYVEGGYIRDIGKKIEKFNAFDTGAFLCTPAIFDAIEKSIKENGDSTLSGGMRVLAKNKKALALDIGDAFWIDVDDENAYKKAENYLLGKLNKKSDGPISRFINRPISKFITKYIVKLPVTPNQMTIFSFLVALLAGILFLFQDLLALGGILTQISSILDGVDGEIARIKYLETKFGKWLDSVLDRYADGIILGGLTWNAYHFHASSGFTLLAGWFAILGSLINSYIAMKYDELMVKLERKNYFRIGRDLRLFFIFTGALVGLPLETLVILGIVMNLENLRRIFVLKKYENLL